MILKHFNLKLVSVRQSYQKSTFRQLCSLKIWDQFYHFKGSKIRSIHTPCQSWFQRFDVCGGLCGLFHIRDGLHTKLMLAAAWLTSAAGFKAMKVIKCIKKRPLSSRQLRKLLMLLSENQLFGTSAGSDLQAINIAAIKKNCCVSLLFYWTKYILFMTIVVLSLFS